nr:hypothetical protein [Tanacetum cinerariifolium]
DTTIDQQVAMDEDLVPHAKRLRIGRSNFRLLLDIKSKESTLQLVYDVLHLSLFFKAFLVTADVLEIYMQEFWATATVHHHSIRFKMDNKKHIVNLESFREMLHICPRLLHQPFVEPPFEEDILAFLRFLGHGGAIRKLTDGLYHKRNVDFAYLIWEDFVYQVKHKDTKKSNEMYYPRFTKFGALLPIELTNEDIRNFNAYKKYYAIAIGATPPMPKASVRKTRSSFNTTITPPTVAAGPRLTTFEKGKQAAKASKSKSLSALSELAMTEAQQMKLATKRSLHQTHISQASGSGVDEGTDDDDQEDERDDGEDDEEDKGGDDEQAFDEEFIHPSLSTPAEKETRDEESFDPIPKTPKNIDDEGNGEENLRTNVGREKGHDEEEEEDKLYRDVNINLGRGIQPGDIHTTQEVEDSDVTLTLVNPVGQQQSSSNPTSVAPLPMSAPTITPSTIATVTTIQLAPTLPTIASSTLLQDLPNFGSLFGFDNRLTKLEANFSEFMQTNQFVGAVSAILEIVHRYMDQRMNETIDENMQKIIKEQVKEQVKVQVFKILPKIEQTMNEKLEAKVLTRSSNSSKTSFVHRGNKSIKRSNEQRNLYKALVEAYESGKIILDAYGYTVTLKRRRDDDADKDEEPSAGSDRGSKRRREGKEPESASAPQEKATRSAGKST